MVRRASSRPQPWLLASCAVGALAAVGAGYALFGYLQDPFRTVQPMDFSAYLDNAQSMRGNVYRVEGSIQHALAWVPAQGRLISVQVDQPGGRHFAALWVPIEFNHVNVQKNQRYRFKVEVMNNGLLKVLDMGKS
jgi:hypothetical protein